MDKKNKEEEEMKNEEMTDAENQAGTEEEDAGLGPRTWREVQALPRGDWRGRVRL